MSKKSLDKFIFVACAQSKSKALDNSRPMVPLCPAFTRASLEKNPLNEGQVLTSLLFQFLYVCRVDTDQTQITRFSRMVYSYQLKVNSRVFLVRIQTQNLDHILEEFCSSFCQLKRTILSFSNRDSNIDYFIIEIPRHFQVGIHEQVTHTVIIMPT